MGKKRRVVGALLAVLILASVVGCGPSADAAVNPGRLYDNKGTYSQPKNGWSELWLDVKSDDGLAFSDATGVQRMEGEKPVFNATLYDGESTLATAETPAYCQVQIKGNQLYRHYYRSLKITLMGEERWQGQRIFTLYKCPQDATKISMRLWLDSFSLLNDVVSVSTGFVRLYLRDVTTGSDEYADYGLYTMAEQLGGRYLRSHGLDQNGELYEAENFDFDPSSWQEMSPKEREAALEYNNGTQPEKLDEMLKALEETDDFDQFFDAHFQRENYLTWLAGAILMGNTRAALGTYQLYSPSDSEIWYFFPSPTDKILKEEGAAKPTDPPPEYFGVGMLYGNELHSRFLQSESNRQALADKVEELRGVLSDKKLAKLCGNYKQVLAEFFERNPDYDLLPDTPQAIEARIDSIPLLVEQNHTRFLEYMDKPSPFEIDDLSREDGGWRLAWQDMAREGENLRYKVKVSTDVNGEETLFSQTVMGTELLLEDLPDGVLYVYIMAQNEDELTQLANSYVTTVDKVTLWGAKSFLITGGEVIDE